MPEETIPSSYERRNRVVFNLPLNNEKEELAVLDVIQYLKAGNHQEKGIAGFTFSEPVLPVFGGFWWSTETAKWIEDKQVMFLLDFLHPASASQTFSIMAELNRLKSHIRDRYSHHGSKQEEVWMVVHPISRIA